MFDAALLTHATELLAQLRAKKLSLTTAESCTGGLIAGLFTEIAGASDVIDRGFVTYSNGAKHDLLGVPGALLVSVGAVSREVAIAMAEGALARVPGHAGGGVAVAVTGIAGPGGGSVAKPVGLVHVAVARSGWATHHRVCHFGSLGRREVRMATIAAALELIGTAIGTP